MPYPNFTRDELIADGIVHLIAILASIIAMTILVVGIGPQLPTHLMIGTAIYAVSAIVMFSFSACYNFTRGPWKEMFRRFDQAGIFLMIAGTYTPLVFLIDTTPSFVVLGIVWALAIAGTAVQTGFAHRTEKIIIPLYLGMSWVGLFIIYEMIVMLPPFATVMIIAGGVFYTIGVLFHIRETMKYHNAIWHVFVLAGAACHYAAVTKGSLYLIN